ncbi:MAG: DNA (cytosine-5-)-methyltransferase [Bacteroidaceae bacterium]|nr:DNA (cytosine-5-)-methyltransferase [Bacteroidaceae bacterium]
MAKKTKAIKLTDFPEEVDEQHGLKWYGELSYETQMAVLSQYLHSPDLQGDEKEVRKRREEIIYCVREYLERKTGNRADEYDDEQVWRVAEDPYAGVFFADFFNVPFPRPEQYRFTFIDLFAGMGGFRLAMQAQGGKCVFSSEWNKYAQKTYFANFGEMPFGDITKEVTKQRIPQNFDILCAGFPCQPFSIAGVSKNGSLGRKTGFQDRTRGTLFFDVADIIQRHRPKAFFLENVKNLVSHDKGRTFRVILETLEELNYSVHYRVMDGKSYVPQHRERILIVGFDRERYHGEENFEFPPELEPVHRIADILEPHPEEKYTLTDNLWNYLQDYAIRQQEKGNGFGFGLVDLNGISRTLSARYYKDGSEILIPQGNATNPRKLTPRECARLMGYPDNYTIRAVSDTQTYIQCGNSVVVPLITAVSEQIVETMLNQQMNSHE